MKKYLYSLALAGATFGLASCDGKQEEPKIQWYPVITLEGESSYNVEVGTIWEDPGYTAINTLDDKDATADVEVLIYDVINRMYVEEIDFDNPGMYTIYYNGYGSVVETDPTSYKTRSIYVYDPSVTLSIEGVWALNMEESYELIEGEAVPFIEDFGEVTSTFEISQMLPGFFNDGDLLAGYYSTVVDMDSKYSSYLSTYGPNCFRLTGYLSMNNDGDITLLSWTRYSSFFQGFSMSNAHFDEATGQISYNAALTWDPFGGAPQYYIVLEKFEE